MNINRKVRGIPILVIIGAAVLVTGIAVAQAVILYFEDLRTEEGIGNTWSVEDTFEVVDIEGHLEFNLTLSGSKYTGETADYEVIIANVHPTMYVAAGSKYYVEFSDGVTVLTDEISINTNLNPGDSQTDVGTFTGNAPGTWTAKIYPSSLPGGFMWVTP